MGDITIESTTDNPEDIERAGKLGPEGNRGMDTGVRVEIPEDGTATVVSKQEIVTAKDNIQPRTVVDDKVVPEPETPPVEAKPEGEPPKEPAKEPDPEPKIEAKEPDPEPVKPKKKQTAAERGEQIQSTIKDLTTKKYETQRDVNAAAAELDQIQQEIARLRTQPVQRETPQPTEPVVEAKPVEETQKPEEKDFDSYDAYRDAVDDWKNDKRDKTLLAQLESRLTERDEQAANATAAQAATTARTTLETEFHGRMRAARDANPDFDEVIGKNPALRLTPSQEVAIMRSKVGPEIMLYFGHNPAEATRIAKLPPGDQIFEMGVLAAQVTGAKNGDQPATPVTVVPEPTTKAAKPVEPVVSTPTPNTVNPDEMSFQDYKVYRRKQEEAAAARR